MKIYDVTSQKFNKYGSIIHGYDFSEVIDVMRRKTIPADCVEYLAADPELEALPVFREFEKGFYGGEPAELGYCMGHNDSLNALEYHKGSEVNISATDYIVLIGLKADMEEDFCYNTKNIEAFYVHAGMAVEFYETTLHYCACHVQKGGYSHATFLPKGTNLPLEEGFSPKTPEDSLLAAKNKWLLVHKDGGFDESFPVKLKGENYRIEYMEDSERRISI